MSMQENIRHLKKTAWCVFSAALLYIPAQSHAALLDLADIPLEVKEGVPPNIILTMDDSGSMAWGFLPDGAQDEWSNHYKSSTYNRIYYNPNVTYLPGVDENGNSLGDANFTSAWLNGYNHAQGTVDLSTNYRPTYYDYRPTSNSWHYHGGGIPADYYLFDSSLTTAGGVPCDINNTAHVSDDNCYTQVVVSATSGVNRYSPEVTGCAPVDTSNPACYTGPDERTNFANWYSYYRLRHLLAKTATTRAFAGLNTNVRVSWQALNTNTTIGDPLPFGGTHRSNFFNWIFSAPTSGGTPLTNATWRAGVKYETDADVYRKDPTDNTSPEYSCRQNFHFAFTDGYWNSNSVNIPGPNNYDAQNITLPTTGDSPYGDINYQANPGTAASDTTPPIYRDDDGNFLGDIALYFWARDLRTSLPNNVPLFIADQDTDIDGDNDVDNFDIFWNPLNDPADWQHMVNFTVGLGIDGALPYNDTTYQALLSGAQHWVGNHVDDLWHAAINSRGRYFSARSPEELVHGFEEVINSIVERKGSASAVTTTSSRYEVGTNLFQAIYDPNDWSGEILAKDVITNSTQWSASTQLTQMINNGVSRNIITFDPANDGIPFQWSSLTTEQQTALNTLNGAADGKGSIRLEWLRGDNSNEEQNGGTLRNRKSYLGDITHSDPVYVPPPGPPLYFYPESLETVGYSTYVSTYANRPNMLLFGANDGMLHILNADTGQELLAYVPNILFKQLSALTDPDYTHQYYIDRTVSVWDVFYGGAWHTVAIGGLGKGGQGLFALDITDPSTFTETNAANLAMWEFTDADDPDLGYTYTTPYMMKMNNDKWMVAFSNGVNSTEPDSNPSSTGDAILFLLDIENGGKGPNGLKIKLSTETGTNEDPLGLQRPNALSDIAAIDTNRDYKVDYIYAGDYFGNLWKFDVSSPDPANWTVYKQGNTPKPLFVARSPNGVPQPITFPPVVSEHTKKHGYLVYVGTGSYIKNDDVTDNTVQTIYGIWDRFETNINTIQRNHLLEQSLLDINTTQFTTTNARNSTDNKMRWFDGAGLPTGSENPPVYLGWRMDLLNNGVAQGERLFDNLNVTSNVLSFTTLIPSLDPCVSGGEAWAFRINADTGSRFLNSSPWDYNADGGLSIADKVQQAGGNTVWGSGIQGKGKRLFRSRTLLIPGSCKEANIQNLADGTIRMITSSCSTRQIGRRSWRQIEIH